jgi:hypothetical protein
MGYSSKAEVIQALATALTSGQPNSPGVLVDVTTVGKLVTDTVNDSEIYQYIRWSDENINAAISSVYQIPLQRINRGSYDLAADVVAAQTFILLADATIFTEGDVVVLRDLALAQSQTLTVLSIPNENRINFTTPITLSYSMLTTKVERIRYPDPIPKMSARLAAAYLYDRHFAAQVDGNESDYGKYLRNLVKQDMNNILAGTIKLLLAEAGQYVGRRYYNAALDDAISTHAEAGTEWFKTS